MMNVSKLVRARPWRWQRMVAASLNSLSVYRRPSLFLVPPVPFTSSGVNELNVLRNFRVCGFSSTALADAAAPGDCATIDVPLAQTGEGIAECELLQWFVQEEDEVDEFQPLCQVQSDKATIDITSRYKGKIQEILHAPGDIVKVGETLVRLVVERTQSQSEAQSPDLEVLQGTKSSNSIQSSEVLSTPAVRNLAKEHGIDLSVVAGTGKGGRITKEDVVRYANGEKLAETAATIQDVSCEKGHVRDEIAVPLRGFQRAMVKTMTTAARVPHFYYVEEINCDALAKLKAAFQGHISDPKMKCTFLPLLIKSLSMALHRFPWMNSSFHEETMEVVLKGSHNIGIAMDTPHGLVVPNLKNVQSLSIMEIIGELSRLQALAVGNKLSPEDIKGGTLTISNIGSIGGKFGTPLINLPEATIIALGRIQRVPRFGDKEDVQPTSVLTVTIGADHRIVDGATVARFCNEWKETIEKPEILMMTMR